MTYYHILLNTQSLIKSCNSEPYKQAIHHSPDVVEPGVDRVLHADADPAHHARHHQRHAQDVHGHRQVADQVQHEERQQVHAQEQQPQPAQVVPAVRVVVQHHQLHGDGAVDGEGAQYAQAHLEAVGHPRVEGLAAPGGEGQPEREEGGHHELGQQQEQAILLRVLPVSARRRVLVVLEAVPAELVAAGARHVVAAADAVDGDLAARAVVGHERDVHEGDQRREAQHEAAVQAGETERTRLLLAHQAPLGQVRERAARERAALHVRGAAQVLLEQDLVHLLAVVRSQLQQRLVEGDLLRLADGASEVLAGSERHRPDLGLHAGAEAGVAELGGVAGEQHCVLSRLEADRALVSALRIF